MVFNVASVRLVAELLQNIFIFYYLMVLSRKPRNELLIGLTTYIGKAVCLVPSEGFLWYILYLVL